MYAKIYHKILTDPRTLKLSLSEFGAFVYVITWCSREETDGRFTYDEVSSGCKFRGFRKSIDRLLTVGLVLDGGPNYVVSAYLKYQTPSATIKAKRAKDRDRKASPAPSGSERKAQGPSTKLKGQSVKESDSAPKPPKPNKWNHVPDDWEPNDKHRARCKELGLNFDDEVFGYRNHYYKDPKVNGDKTFYTWMANTVKFGRDTPSAPRQRGSNRGTTTPQQAQMDRQMERIRQAEAEEKAGTTHPQIVENRNDTKLAKWKAHQKENHDQN